MVVKSYQQLKVWQTGMQIAQQAYIVSQRLPKHEIYGLTSQIRRAAVSIPANIAEGNARDSTKEYLHHISIALGSLAELETLLMLARDLKYCDFNEVAPPLCQCDEEGKMLRALQNSLKSRLNS